MHAGVLAEHETLSVTVKILFSHNTTKLKYLNLRDQSNYNKEEGKNTGSYFRCCWLSIT
jgi:hypothetical protein